MKERDQPFAASKVSVAEVQDSCTCMVITSHYNNTLDKFVITGHMLGKCLPSFIIAGTQKSGTTALAGT